MGFVTNVSQTFTLAADRRSAHGWLRTSASTLFDELIQLAKTPAAVCAALLILPIAGILTGMGVVVAYAEYLGQDLPDRLMLNKEKGISEHFEYILTGISALAMLLTWQRTRASVYLVFAMFFGWLTADNSLQLHERAGTMIAPALRTLGGPTTGSNHYGEAIVLLAVGALLVGMTVLSLARCAEVHRIRAAALLLLTGCTAVFGVGLDIVDALVFAHGSAAQHVGHFVEDAGELWLLCATAIVAQTILFRSLGEAHLASGTSVTMPLATLRR